jgi:hypothetical protein
MHGRAEALFLPDFTNNATQSGLPLFIIAPRMHYEEVNAVTENGFSFFESACLLDFVLNRRFLVNTVTRVTGAL